MELSYLSDEKQQMIYEAYSLEDGTMVEKIDMKKAKAIRRMYEDNNDFTGGEVLY